ncbi:protein piccolo [Pelomyxa schiedti]|nr:protein piccolo [Pelomyxa schiedti]
MSGEGDDVAPVVVADPGDHNNEHGGAVEAEDDAQTSVVSSSPLLCPRRSDSTGADESTTLSEDASNRSSTSSTTSSASGTGSGAGGGGADAQREEQEGEASSTGGATATATDAADTSSDEEPPMSQEEMNALHRHQVVKELQSTEITYSKGLHIIINEYLEPFKSMPWSSHNTALFQNVTELAELSDTLLPLLSAIVESWQPESCISHVIVELLPRFDIYFKYLENHHVAIETTQKLMQKDKFVAFLQAVHDKPMCQGRDLLTFLITPVQRIPRYLLLFKDYAKHLPEGHPDETNCQLAMAGLAKLADAANDSIRKEQNCKKIYEITHNLVGLSKDAKQIIENPDHLFIREGPLFKVCRKTVKKRYFWLFTDSLIYGTQVASASGTFTFHRLIMLAKTKVVPITDTADFKHAFQIISSEKSFTVGAESENEKDFWIMDLNEILKGERRGKHMVNKTLQEVNTIDTSGAAPVWIPDKNAKFCMICSQVFNVIIRRHHCRKCGKVMCGNCSRQRSLENVAEKHVRVCKFCNDLVDIENSGQLKTTRPHSNSQDNPAHPTHKDTAAQSPPSPSHSHTTPTSPTTLSSSTPANTPIQTTADLAASPTKSPVLCRSASWVASRHARVQSGIFLSCHKGFAPDGSTPSSSLLLSPTTHHQNITTDTTQSP